MSSRKKEVKSMTNLTINSLVRLAIVYVFIPYPHEKITVTKSCGAERKLKIVTGTIP
jgi:hypothetical protein